jgi:hypothetical protein
MRRFFIFIVRRYLFCLARAQVSIILQMVPAGPAGQEFADLLECRELRFVRLDDHPSMIDLNPLPQPPMPLATRTPVQPPIPLEETRTCGPVPMDISLGEPSTRNHASE